MAKTPAKAAPAFNPDDYKAILPDWAKALAPGRVEADPALFVPVYQKELGIDKLDQYWLAVIWTFMRRDLERAVEGTKLDAPAGGARIFLVTCRPEFAERNHTVGKGPQAARDPKSPHSARALYIAKRGRF